MLKLFGIPISNYYNKVKLALLEKGIPFEEVALLPGQDESVVRYSPAGKIPFLLTDQGAISESQAILEYLEDAYPENPLYPADLFARAKCREFILHLELNVELVARRLYAEAFFGGSVSDETKAEVREKLAVGIEALNRLVKFGPYVMGERFTAADCTCWASLILLSLSTSKIYGEDFLQKIPGVAEYQKTLEARPHVRKVAADRAVALEAFFGRK
jgi:glutathione S-transferase